MVTGSTHHTRLRLKPFSTRQPRSSTKSTSPTTPTRWVPRPNFLLIKCFWVVVVEIIFQKRRYEAVRRVDLYRSVRTVVNLEIYWYNIRKSFPFDFRHLKWTQAREQRTSVRILPTVSTWNQPKASVSLSRLQTKVGYVFCMSTGSSMIHK